MGIELPTCRIYSHTHVFLRNDWPKKLFPGYNKNYQIYQILYFLQYSYNIFIHNLDLIVIILSIIKSCQKLRFQRDSRNAKIKLLHILYETHNLHT